MLIMMKRDWAYDLIPGSTRRTLPKGLPFDVAPEVAAQAIAEGAADAVVVTFPEAPVAEAVVDGDGEGNDGAGTGATAEPVPAPAPAARTKKAAAAPASAEPVEPAPAEPVEPA